MSEAAHEAESESPRGPGPSPPSTRSKLFARLPVAALSAVALVAVWETLAQSCLVRAVPTQSDWAAAHEYVARTRREGDLVAAAPRWADPLARLHLGEFIPLEDAARPDATRYGRALVATIRGATEPDFAGWPQESEQSFGRLTVRVLRNPSPARVRFDFVRALNDPQGSGSEVRVSYERAGGSAPCSFREHMGVQGGGLGQGALAGPSRWVCSGPYVGRTVVEDMEHRGRLCIWAEPQPGARLRVGFSGVSLGSVVRGYHAVAYEAERGGDHYETGEPVSLDVRVDGASVGTAVHEDGEGWKGFSFALGARAEGRGDVEFVVTVPPPRDDHHRQARHYCFQADTR